MAEDSSTSHSFLIMAPRAQFDTQTKVDDAPGFDYDRRLQVLVGNVLMQACYLRRTDTPNQHYLLDSTRKMPYLFNLTGTDILFDDDMVKDPFLDSEATDAERNEVREGAWLQDEKFVVINDVSYSTWPAFDADFVSSTLMAEDGGYRVVKVRKENDSEDKRQKEKRWKQKHAQRNHRVKNLKKIEEAKNLAEINTGAVLVDKRTRDQLFLSIDNLTKQLERNNMVRSLDTTPESAIALMETITKLKSDVIRTHIAEKSRQQGDRQNAALSPRERFEGRNQIKRRRVEEHPANSR